jgi:threonine/homoserine/homoserine lactone efflux protein
MIVIFLHALSLATTPLLSFGPFKILVLSTALQHGWRRSLPLALTPLVADIPVILLVWLLLRRLPEDAIHLLRISGGLFFFYLATVLFRNARMMQKSAEAATRASSGTFWQAVTSIWIAPQVYINWTAVGIPALLGYSQEGIWRGLAFLLFFYILWIGGLSVQIILFSQAGKVNTQANTYLIMIASLLLVGFGIYQIWLGTTGLIPR